MASSEQMKAKARAALLECNTLTEAADKAGISRKTLYNYMKMDPTFAAEYQEAQERLALEEMGTVAKDRAEARAVIVEIMNNSELSPVVRLKAAASLYGIAATQQSRIDTIMAANTAHNPFTDML